MWLSIVFVYSLLSAKSDETADNAIGDSEDAVELSGELGAAGELDENDNSKL